MKISIILATVAISAALMGLALYFNDKIDFKQNPRFLTETVISDMEFEFINFISKHQRTYSTMEEYYKRLLIFEKNYVKIQ